MSALQEILNRFHARRFEQFLKHSLSTLLGVFLPHERVLRVPLDSIQDVIVVRQHNQLGDMLCAVPLLRALRQRLPKARIDLVASPVNYEVMLNNPYLDEVILYDKLTLFRSPAQLITFYQRLRKQHYDLAIVPSTVSMSFTSDAMAYLSGARYRIGAASIDGAENMAGHFFNLPLTLDWKGKEGVHQTDRNLEFVRCTDVDTDDLGAVIRLTEEEKKFSEEFFSRISEKKRYLVGFHPGAGKPQNRWPAERFARVAEKLAREKNAFLFITAGPMDDEPIERMTKNLYSEFFLVKEKSVRKVAAIIDRLSLFVTNDTGVMHVAGATSTRVLSLFGPSDPLQWAPNSARHKFLVSRNRDINSITEDEVYSAALELLSRA